MAGWAFVRLGQPGVVGEMVAGIERLPESRRRRSLDNSLKYLREDYAGKILDFTEGVAVVFGAFAEFVFDTVFGYHYA